MTLQLFNQSEICQITLTSFVEDFHAKRFQLVDIEKDLRTVEVLSFLKLHGFSDITETLDSQYPVFYSKMLKAYLTTTMDAHLLQSTEFLVTLGIPLSFSLLILSGGSPKIVSEYTLSDILEEEVDQKYFLSQSQIEVMEEHKKRNEEAGRGFGAKIIQRHSGQKNQEADATH